MGTSKRVTQAASENPGPGKYEAIGLQNVMNTAPQYTFRIKNQNEFKLDKLNCSPGPGNYDPKWKMTKLAFSAYSIALKTKGKKNKDSTPGVGHYALRKEAGDFDVGAYK